ncbi:MAG: SDR family oxidoreductase [Acidimicrobiales bacterium]
MDTENQVCIVTGGTRGIGAATAQRLAIGGTTMLVSYVNNDEAAAQFISQLGDTGNEVHAIKADVSSEADVLAMFAAADDLGRLSTLVNNAGILFPISRLADFDLGRIERTLAVNVTGTLLCCREAVKRMSTASGGRGGVIINVSSRAASFGSPNDFVDYAASKGAVDTLTIGLAAEVAREGIRVNAVRPGLIDTEIHASAGFADRVFALGDKVPMGRHGTAEEVAASIAWLASEEASYITGALLDVGGGR